jgi:peptidoglycan-N-acetylglucosamine deacetylase
MNRRHFLTLAAAPCLLPSCRSTKPVTVPPPLVPPPVTGSVFRPGPVPRRLPVGIPVSFSSCAVNGPYVAMTFDDGPHLSQTPRLLDMLDRWQIKATFFVIGKNVVSHPGIVRRIVNSGHEIANHSWSHPALSKLSADAVRSELRRTHDAIVDACGVAPLTYRPPYGAITAEQKQWIAREFGYPTIMWSVDPNDWKDRNAAVVASRLKAGARSGSILLAHDIHPSTVSAMPSTLPVMAAGGKRFVTISQLITISAMGGGGGPVV